MSAIVEVSLSVIDSNPFRQLDKYPYVERKVAALVRSYADVGMWEGVIARQQGNRYEIAFGHHRVEAARQAGLTVMPIIVRPLSDEQMLQFMGRENMEDYNADFLCMLETWEAAVVFVDRRGERRGKLQAIDIARILGWTELHKEGSDVRHKDPHITLNRTAVSCSAAYALINAGHLAREDLRDLTVHNVREIVQNLQSRIEQLDKMARQTQRPVEEVEAAKEHLAKAAITTAEKVRDGEIATKDARATADAAAYQFARQANRPSPLFEVFRKNLAD
jgi:ParB-like chromosome segregation protein Spo0J